MIHQRFFDPLYGPVAIDSRTRPLAFSPEIQRLRYVRLCNINSLFLTGASEPKRFEHCIGVYHLADTWAAARKLDPQHASIVRAAALLHDMQTGPFGHSFQYVMEDNQFEQKFEHANLTNGVESQFLQRARAGAAFAGRLFTVPELLGDIADSVYAAIRGEGPYGPIISGTLDLDNLDNVVRLAAHMGICDDEDRAVPKTLAPLLQLHNGELAAPNAARPIIERWFHIRQRLYEYLLLDRGEFAAKAMLTRAVELAADAHLLGPDDWRLTDDELLAELQARSVGDHQAVGQVIKRLLVGDLFGCIGVWQTHTTSTYDTLSDAKSKRRLERLIEAELARGGVTKIRVSLHYILDCKKTCRLIRYRDLYTGNERNVGYDSDVLLVGAFIASARTYGLGKQEKQRLGEVTKRVIAGAGLAHLRPATEPLSDAHEADDLFAR